MKYLKLVLRVVVVTVLVALTALLALAWPQVKRITPPTLILWGARDQLITPEYGEQFQREIAGSQLVVFDALGHVPQEEDPATTAAALASFLGSKSESTTTAERSHSAARKETSG